MDAAGDMACRGGLQQQLAQLMAQAKAQREGTVAPEPLKPSQKLEAPPKPKARQPPPRPPPLAAADVLRRGRH